MLYCQEQWKSQVLEKSYLEIQTKQPSSRAAFVGSRHQLRRFTRRGLAPVVHYSAQRKKYTCLLYSVRAPLLWPAQWGRIRAVQWFICPLTTFHIDLKHGFGLQMSVYLVCLSTLGFLSRVPWIDSIVRLKNWHTLSYPCQIVKHHRHHDPLPLSLSL